MTGNELKNSLKALGVSQRKFAAEADVCEETVSRWIAGKIKVPMLVDKYIKLRLLVREFQT